VASSLVPATTSLPGILAPCGALAQAGRGRFFWSGRHRHYNIVTTRSIATGAFIVPSTNAASFDAGADDVFGRIAGRYDLLCDVFSFGIHRYWKHRAATLIAAQSWATMIDAAAGTGDVALRVVRQDPALAGREIIVSDISPAMLGIARRHIVAPAARLDFRILDAHAMPEVRDASIDLYAISFALKICDRERVVQEAFRVLRPGGRLVALEASAIRWPWLHRLYLGYMDFCLPVIGWIATGGDASAYRYLLTGVHAFPDAEGLAEELRHMGFTDIAFERLSLGIVAIHTARKPG
jgi:demethylmenaquinone methyltransferase / 2-methoxy-6-polyprenyl-1,4-benzoquinol methylase